MGPRMSESSGSGGIKRGLWIAALLVLGLGGLTLAAPPLTPSSLHAPSSLQPDAQSPVTVITTTPPPPAISLTPQELVARVVPSIVTITSSARFTTTAGTGIVLSPDGVVLTNHHVISGGTEITAVNMSNGLIYDVEVLGYDSGQDLALLRLVGASDLPTATVGSSQRAARGDPVTAIGNADGEGVPLPAPGTITGFGVTVNTRNSTDGSRNQLKGLIEVNADIRPGDSGGPLVNAAAELIGVSSAGNAIEDRTEVSPSPQSYAIPIDTALPIVDQILSGRSSETVRVGPTPVLGVAVKDHVGSPAGAEVVAVSFDSPAEVAGVTKGDVITGFGGAPITSTSDLNIAMSMRHPGDMVDLIWFDAQGQHRSGSLVLDEGPPR